MNKQNAAAEIRQARNAAGLSLNRVSRYLGRSFEWLRRIEVGTLKAKPETVGKILLAIENLAAARANKTAIASASSESQQRVRE